MDFVVVILVSKYGKHHEKCKNIAKKTKKLLGLVQNWNRKVGTESCNRRVNIHYMKAGLITIWHWIYIKLK